jgi:nicotinate-nucleotide adenylyltransferase
LSPHRRIGLLGGSFDPPHLAHLALGRVATRALELDELRWLPARAPWQKAERVMAGVDDRLAMLRLLVEGEPRWVIDERELRREGLTYTIDTVRELAAEQPGADWFMIIGQDQYARFDTWRDWRELLQRLTLAVAARQGAEPQAPPALAQLAHRVVLLTLPRLDISASDIRRRCAAGASPVDLEPLVGAPIAGYIARHGLYRGR